MQVGELDARRRATLPTIVAGDLNAAPEAASIRYLSGLQTLGGRGVHYHDAWALAGHGPGHTWSVDNPVAAAEIERLVGQPGHRRRIDYVFVGSAHAHPRARARVLAARLVGDRPVDGVWLSDHAGVLVDLEVEAAPPGSRRRLSNHAGGFQGPSRSGVQGGVEGSDATPGGPPCPPS